MTKLEFLSSLGQKLSQLPEAERAKRLDYYDELLSDMTEDGLSEQEAVEKLGDISAIAEQIMQDTPFSTLVKTRMRPRRGWTPLSIVLTILGAPVWLPIAAALLAVLLVVFAVFWVVIIVLFVAVLSIAVSGIALIGALFTGVVTGFPGALLLVGGALACTGIAILVFWGARYAAKGAVKLSARLGRWVKSLFIRKEA